MARLAAEAGRPSPLLARLLSLPDGLDALRPTLEVRATALVRGDERWRIGLVQVWTFDRRGRFLWYWPKEVASLSHSQDWRIVEATIPIAEVAAATYLVLYNGAVSGDMTVRDIRVAALAERAAFRVARVLLQGAWIVAAAWVVVALIRATTGGRLRYAFLAAALATLAGVLTPQPHFKALVAPIETVAHGLLASEPAEVAAPEMKGNAAGQEAPPGAVRGAARSLGLKSIGHFAAFAALTLLAALAFPRTHPVTIAGYLILLAAASESLQRFLITRSSQGLDLAADVAGVLLAIAAVALLRRVLRSRRTPQ